MGEEGGFIYSGMRKGQLENVGGVLKLENHSFETMGKMGSSTSRQWLLNLVRNIEDEQDISVAFKHLPLDYLVIVRE